MRRRELDEIEVDILAYLLENGEQRFIEIAEALFPKHEKTFHQDENHFKVVLVRKLDRLREKGFIEKRMLSSKNVRYSIQNAKKENVVKMIRHYQNIEFIEKLPPEEVDRLIKENERLKRLNRIYELEELKALPLRAVLKKLVDEYGFKIEDFYDKHHLKDPEFQRMLKNFYQGKYEHFITPDLLHNYHSLGDTETELAEINNIEIKLIPKKEVEGLNILTPDEVWRKYGSGWIILAHKPIKGYYIIGAYKELLQLYMEQFEDEWLEWKEKFNLSDEDWRRVGPYIAFAVMFDAGRADLPYMVGNELYEYVQSQKPDGLETLTQHYMKWLHLKRAEAEKQAKATIESMRKFRMLPVEEIWKQYEEDVARLGNEEWQRTFQYLKAKHCPRL